METYVVEVGPSIVELHVVVVAGMESDVVCLERERMVSRLAGHEWLAGGLEAVKIAEACIIGKCKSKSKSRHHPAAGARELKAPAACHVDGRFPFLHYSIIIFVEELRNNTHK
ncbi:hypothetical protein N9L19_01135 [bacterium]|nr:hypothetical protein [bacterium]